MSNETKLKQFEPPEILYYITNPANSLDIIEEKKSIKPTNQSHIILYEDIKTANKIGIDFYEFPSILPIDSKKAHEDGVKFFKDDNNYWYTMNIDVKYIK